MRTLGRAIAVFLVVQALVPTRASGQEGFASTGGTVVTVDAPIVTITVTIDFVVPDPGAASVRESADQIAQSIMDYWNDGLDQFATDCLLYNLVVTINPVAESAARTITIEGHETYVTTPGHHVVAWGGNGPEAPWPETYDPYDPDQTANPGEDYSTPFTHELWAVWSGELETPRDYAHEFGHLLGFGDDTRRSGLPIPERQGTLMDSGDRIDQKLADRLAAIIDSSGTRLPECWTGTVDLTLSKDYLAEPAGLPPEVCTGSWRVTPTFVVAADGTITGSARAELTSGPDCTFEIPGTGSTAAFNVAGMASADALELRFTQTSIQPPGDWMGFQGAMVTTFRVERVGTNRAEGETPIATTDGGPFPVMGEASIALECSSCSS